MFNFNDSYKIDGKLEVQHDNDKKLSSMLRAISIGATTLSAYQIASLGLAGSPTFHIDSINTDISIISLVAIPFGYVFGSRLENAFSTNAQKLSELSGKTFKQESRVKDLNGAKAGFTMALALNIITFTGGVYFSAYTAMAIQDHFKGGQDQTAYYMKLKEGNTKRMEQDLKELSPQSIKAYIDSHRLDGKSQTGKIRTKYQAMIDQAKKRQDEALNEIEAERKNNLLTKVRRGHKKEDVAWIEKKYQEKRAKALKEVESLKDELSRVLLSTGKKDIDILQLERGRKAELEEDISKLTIANDALDKKINTIKAKREKAKEGVSWMLSFIAALVFYAFQFMANIAEQRSFDRLERQSKRSEIKDKSFNLEDFILPTEDKEDKEDDNNNFLEDIATLINKEGKIPNTHEVSSFTGLHINKVADMFKRNKEYFVRENGKPTVYTKEFEEKYMKEVA